MDTSPVHRASDTVLKRSDGVFNRGRVKASGLRTVQLWAPECVNNDDSIVTVTFESNDNHVVGTPPSSVRSPSSFHHEEQEQADTISSRTFLPFHHPSY